MNDDASSPPPDPSQTTSEVRRDKSSIGHFFDWLRGRNGETARDQLEELIEETEDGETSLNTDERQLLLNILELRDQTVADVMVPRADIIAIKVDSSLETLIEIISEEAHSRMPLYRETLDDAFAIVHVKDVLAWKGRDEEFSVSSIVRPVLFVAPSMQVLELLLEMRAKRVHMALVVDEFGGIDGLLTIEDLVEEIVGEIEDEFDQDEKPFLEKRFDGSWDASARTLLEDLEAALGIELFNDVEHDEIDTLGGLVFSVAGRVPSRGELLRHKKTGIEFEILDVDPRRIKRLRLRVPEALLSDGLTPEHAPPGPVPAGEATAVDVIPSPPPSKEA